MSTEMYFPIGMRESYSGMYSDNFGLNFLKDNRCDCSAKVNT